MSTRCRVLGTTSKMPTVYDFEDKFDDNIIGSEWTTYPQGETIEETSDVLRIQFAAGTAHTWDPWSDSALRCTYTDNYPGQEFTASAKIAVYDYAGASTNHCYGLYVAKRPETGEDRTNVYRIGVHIDSGLVKLRVDRITPTASSILRNDALPVSLPFWLRIRRESASKVLFEYSTDNEIWTLYYTVVGDTVLTADNVALGLFAWNEDVTGSGRCDFDEVYFRWTSLGGDYTVHDYSGTSSWYVNLENDDYMIFGEDAHVSGPDPGKGTHFYKNDDADPTATRTKGFQADVRIDEGQTGEVGIVVCRGDDNNFYAATLDYSDNKIRFIKVKGGISSIISDKELPFSITRGIFYTIGMSFDIDDPGVITVWCGTKNQDETITPYETIEDRLLVRDSARQTGYAGVVSNGGSQFTGIAIATILGSIASGDFPELTHKVCVEAAPLDRIVLQYDSALGAAFNEAVRELTELQTDLDDFIEDQQDVNAQYDSLLNRSNSESKTLAEYAADKGLITPAAGDKTKIAQIMEDQYGVTIVGGLFLQQGEMSLIELRKAYILMGCDLDRLREFLDNDFILIWTYQTVSTTTPGRRTFYDPCTGTTKTVDEPCSADAPSEITITESVAGINISKEAAAEAAGKEEGDLLGYLFWLGEIDTSSTVAVNLVRLGVTGEELTAALQAESIEGFDVYVVEHTDIIEFLEALGLVDSDLNTLLCDLELPSVGDPENIFDSIQSALTSSGTKDGTTPSALIAATLDLPAMYTLTSKYDDAVAAVEEDEASEWCLTLLAIIESTTTIIVGLTDKVQDILGSFALDAGANIGLSKEMSAEGLPCIIAPSLGVSVSVEVSLIGEALQALALAFLPISISISGAIEAIRNVTCIAQALISALTGGGCGPDLPDLSFLCPEEVIEALEALQEAMDLMSVILTSLLSAIRLMALNLSDSISLQLDFESTLDSCSIAPIQNLVVVGLKLLEE